MKKILITILTIILGCLMLTACNDNKTTLTDYVTENGRCIISISEEYGICYESNADKIQIITTDLIKGEPRKENLLYYSILSGEQFRIHTPSDVSNLKNNEGQTLVYWKLNDKLYKDTDGMYSKNTFTCIEDTEITPIYCAFRCVGIIMREADDKENTPLVPETDLFDANGNIKEQEGVYFLYGAYDFDPRREVWKTNFTIEDFKVSIVSETVAENYRKQKYTIDVKIKTDTMFDRKQFVLEGVYKIEGHEYMLFNGSSAHLLNKDTVATGAHAYSVGCHSIKYTFV